MIVARFRIELPAHLWVSELSRRFSGAEFRLLSGVRSEGRAVELGEVRTDAPDRVLEAMADHEAVSSLEALESGDDRALAKYETPQTDLYEFAELSGVPVEFPVAVRDGRYDFDLTGTRAELDDLRAVLEASPLGYELESLVAGDDADGPLTDRQDELLGVAARHGYFEVPRGCTLAEVADAAGVDTSTASTVLRRAQARLVVRYRSGVDRRR